MKKNDYAWHRLTVCVVQSFCFSTMFGIVVDEHVVGHSQKISLHTRCIWGYDHLKNSNLKIIAQFFSRFIATKILKKMLWTVVINNNVVEHAYSDLPNNRAADLINFSEKYPPSRVSDMTPKLWIFKFCLFLKQNFCKNLLKLLWTCCRAQSKDFPPRSV